MSGGGEARPSADSAAPNMLLWLDLETTGSDESRDSIIEVGCILTTHDLAPVGEFSAVVSPAAEGYGRMMLNPTVRAMHSANNLLWELAEGDSRKPHEVTKDLLLWLTANGAKEGRTVLAGSGVGHFDRRFITRYMPQLDRFLRYWCIDIGVIRRAHEMWVGTVVSTANDGKTHRALDDARCHLAEAQAFRDLWRAQRFDGIDQGGYDQRPLSLRLGLSENIVVRRRSGCAQHFDGSAG